MCLQVRAHCSGEFEQGRDGQSLMCSPFLHGGIFSLFYHVMNRQIATHAIITGILSLKKFPVNSVAI